MLLLVKFAAVSPAGAASLDQLLRTVSQPPIYEGRVW